MNEADEAAHFKSFQQNKRIKEMTHGDNGNVIKKY
jgi:hypothetical protein